MAKQPWETDTPPVEQPPETQTPPTEQPPEVLEEETPEYAEMKVPELRSMLELRELDTSGTKAELVSRLEADDAEREEEAAPEAQQASLALANLVSRGMSVADARAYLEGSEVSDTVG